MGTRRRIAVLLSACTAAGLGLIGTPALGAVRAPTLWPLGDSITYGLAGSTSAGTMSVEGETPGGYRGTLDAELNQDNAAHQFAGTLAANSTPLLTQEGQSQHDGHPGYRIDQIAADLDGTAGGPTDDGGYWMTRTAGPVQPDVVILLIGGNDIVQRYDPATAFPTTDGRVDYSDPSQVNTFVTDLTGRLGSLIQEIESLRSGTKVVLCDTPPIGTTKVDNVTGPYASAVRALAGQEAAGGVPVSFVDIWSSFVESTSQGEMVVPGLMSPDGLHPSSAGYQLIAQLLRTPVESALAG